ncbi:hypothetical protein Rhal01_03417 [Rubritalea halochordaticola]|uniref:Uncharacterized protein n=1 Tax=Rubritalea halochordaticola TaxID=714537 RepID=A0ABP9V6R0_9BACT
MNKFVYTVLVIGVVTLHPWMSWDSMLVMMAYNFEYYCLLSLLLLLVALDVVKFFIKWKSAKPKR